MNIFSAKAPILPCFVNPKADVSETAPTEKSALLGGSMRESGFERSKAARSAAVKVAAVTAGTTALFLTLGRHARGLPTPPLSNPLPVPPPSLTPGCYQLEYRSYWHRGNGLNPPQEFGQVWNVQEGRNHTLKLAFGASNKSSVFQQNSDGVLSVQLPLEKTIPDGQCFVTLLADPPTIHPHLLPTGFEFNYLLERDLDSSKVNAHGFRCGIDTDTVTWNWEYLYSGTATATKTDNC